MLFVGKKKYREYSTIEMIVTEQVQIGKKTLIASGILIRISKQLQYSVTSLRKNRMSCLMKNNFKKLY